MNSTFAQIFKETSPTVFFVYLLFITTTRPPTSVLPEAVSPLESRTTLLRKRYQMFTFTRHAGTQKTKGSKERLA